MRDAGLSFDIAPADIDESVYPATLSPDAVARHLALAKARHVAGVINADKYVIGADTIVVVGDAVLGKPIDASDALRMLRMMSETTQHVITGLAIVNAMRDIEHVEHVDQDLDVVARHDGHRSTAVAAGPPPGAGVMPAWIRRAVSPRIPTAIVRHRAASTTNTNK